MENIIKKAIEGGWKPTDDWDEVEFTGIKSFSGLSFALGFKGVYSESDACEDSKITAGAIWESTIHIGYRTAVCDPLFWQALGKECGWGKQRIWLNPYTPKGRYIPNQNVDRWTQEAMNFHEINLTEGWDKAIEYLQSITTPEGSK